MTVDTLHVEDRLLDYVYGELPQADARAVEQHLSACAGCAQQLRQMSGVRAVMARLPQEDAPPAGLESLLSYAEKAATRNAAAQEPTSTRGVRSTFSRWVGALAGASAFALVALVAVQVNRDTPAVADRVALSKSPVQAPAAVPGTVAKSEALAEAREESYAQPPPPAEPSRAPRAAARGVASSEQKAAPERKKAENVARSAGPEKGSGKGSGEGVPAAASPVGALGGALGGVGRAQAQGSLPAGAGAGAAPAAPPPADEARMAPKLADRPAPSKKSVAAAAERDEAPRAYAQPPPPTVQRAAKADRPRAPSAAPSAPEAELAPMAGVALDEFESDDSRQNSVAALLAEADLARVRGDRTREAALLRTVLGQVGLSATERARALLSLCLAQADLGQTAAAVSSCTQAKAAAPGSDFATRAQRTLQRLQEER